MFHSAKIRMVLGMIVAGIAVTQWSGRASAQVIDCNTAGPNALQNAIDLGQYLIEFTGTCNEYLGIFGDDVYLLGSNPNPALNVINGGATVAVAQDIFIENLKIQGDGLSIVNGAVVFVENSIVENTNYGVFIARNSEAWLEGNTFGPALIDDGSQSCTPICVGENSYVRMIGNTVNGATNDPFAGAALGIYRDATVLLRGGNVITNTGTQPAIGVWNSSSLRQDSRSGLGTDQITGGVEVFNTSIFETLQAAITGDITVDLNSTMRVGSNFDDASLMVINDAVHLSRDSALWVANPLVTINGDVTCADGESSAAGSFAGTGKNLCSGFSSVDSDFNGDGKSDLLWRNGGSGTVVLWLMDGSTRLAAQSIGTVPLGWVIEKVEDYNGDGKSDIFWRNGATGGNIVWLMDGFAKTPKPVPKVPVAWELQP